MQEKSEQQRIDDLVEHIDAFMKNGGGRMNITGGEGEAHESFCTSCCGEFTDAACNTPAGKSEE